MDTYLPISEAAKLLKLSEHDLTKLTQNGIIRTAMLSGALLLNENDVQAQIPLRERPEYAEFTALAGHQISLSEGNRRYGISHATISRWIKRGVLTAIKRTGREVYVDEAELATCAKIYHASGGGQGRWVFHGSTTYSKKTC